MATAKPSFNQGTPLRPAVSAHRGGIEGVQPGTLAAYRAAASAGADCVEFDVRRTHDGQMVVFHDECTGDGVPIASLTLAELQAHLNRHVPRIEEIMEAVGGHTVCQIDLKEVGYEHAVVDLALAIVGADGFVVTTLEDESVRAIKDAYPDVRVGLSLGRDMSAAPIMKRLKTGMSELFPARRVRACRPDFLSLHYKLAQLAGLRFCARRGLGAFVWTVNDDDKIKRVLCDPRVECVITDRPRRALSLRDRQGRSGPPD